MTMVDISSIASAPSAGQLLAAARAALQRGWAVTPLRGKRPLLPDWPRRRLTESDLPRALLQATGLGIVLGRPSGGLVDVDVDDRLAEALAPAFLPATHARFGREGRPRHYLYSVPPAETPRRLAWQGPDGAMLVELRGDGCQTALPPSRFPDGATVCWVDEGEPAQATLATLRAAVNHLAAAALVARHWRAGQRESLALHLSGGLLRAGWAPAAVGQFVAAVAQAADDEETPKRLEAVVATARKLAAGEATTGWPSLAELIGEPSVALLRRWLGVGDAAPSPAPAPDAPDPLQGGQHGDARLAALLVPLFRDRWRFVPAWNCWRRWDGVVWRPAAPQQAIREAGELLTELCARQLAAGVGPAARAELGRLLQQAGTVARLKAALVLVAGADGILTPPVADGDRSPWDQDGSILVFRNGTLDLREFVLRPHDSKRLVTRYVDACYDPAAPCPRWLAQLELALPDADVRRFLQRSLGVALSGEVLEETLQIWYGAGANGKTTAARVLLGMLGSYAKQAPSALLLDAKFDRHPTEQAFLEGARLVFLSELDEERKLAEAATKLLTGGDEITARKVHENFYTFKRTFSLILCSNHLPTITGSDDGIWRRVRIVPWRVDIPAALAQRGEKQRPQEEVVAELLEERDGIAAWLVAGLQDYLAEPGWLCPAVQVATQNYREEMDQVAAFLRDRCQVDAVHSVALAALHAAYYAWAEQQGERPFGRRGFSRRLRDHHLEVRRSHGQWVVRGLRLLPQNGDDPHTRADDAGPAAGDQGDRTPAFSAKLSESHIDSDLRSPRSPDAVVMPSLAPGEEGRARSAREAPWPEEASCCPGCGDTLSADGTCWICDADADDADDGVPAACPQCGGPLTETGSCWTCMTGWCCRCGEETGSPTETWCTWCISGRTRATAQTTTS